MGKIFYIFIILLFLPLTVFSETYTVKKGDNLWKISKKFNIPVDDIKKANNLKMENLQVGMKIEIPTKKSKKLKEINPVKATEANNKYHIVKKGDNLYRIAKKYSISMEDLKRLNNIKDNKLSVGQKLIVKKIEQTRENISLRADEKVPILATAKIDHETKLDEIENLKANEEISNLNITDRILLFAKKMLHLPYRFGGNGFTGLDCSFFVKKVYSMVGIELPRSAREQFTQGIAISKDELMPGDLVFFRTYAKFPSHVGIYIGDNLFIHASSRSKKVTIDSLEAPYYVSRFIGAKRILDIDKDALTRAIKQAEEQSN